MEITFFYIPLGSRTEATDLGDKAIHQKLAACSNIFPITSAFPWKGILEREEEFVLVLKTMPTHSVPLRQFLEEHHPYDIPCILSWNAAVNDAYGKWMVEELEVSSE